MSGILRKPTNEGFTLIELMIVIAIIGILAAIAIPNFISYRNKTYCATAESDGHAIAGAIADYFAIPHHFATPNINDLNQGLGHKFTLSNNLIEIAGVDPNVNITITVHDGSDRCPVEYQNAMNSTDNPKSFWDGANSYTLRISQ